MKIGMKKQKRMEVERIIQNGIENIDYVTCKICGFKSTVLLTHINRFHKMPIKEYKEEYYPAEVYSQTLKDKWANRMKVENPNDDPEAIRKMRKTKASTKEERSRKAKEQFANGGRKVSNNTGRGRNGYREDLGHSCRSMWEANFARVLKYKGINYQYEPKVFSFYDEHGELINNYLPDFYLPKYNIWIEVKGQMDELSKTKIELFQNHYPNEKLFIVDAKKYKNMAGAFTRIVEWEYSKKT